MSTPPYDPSERPQDTPHVPGQPSQYPSQPSQYPGQPSQYPTPGHYQQYPPAQPGGYAPQPYNPTQQGYNPYGTGGYGYGLASPGQLAGWPIRVGASLIDSLLGVVPVITTMVIAIATSPNLEAEMTDREGYTFFSGYLIAIVLQVWNRVFKQGKTGQSIGKKLTGLKVVDQGTGQLIGFGRNFGREVCALVFNQFCILNVLWPLWDEKMQTWHDKVASDVVIRV